jgi:hypothetical protein
MDCASPNDFYGGGRGNGPAGKLCGFAVQTLDIVHFWEDFKRQVR